MKKTTPPPCIDVVRLVPDLEDLARTTTRLHPRKGEVADPAASKLGGTFLWPADEPWPACDHVGPPEWWDDGICKFPQPGEHGPMVPVLQLRKDDFPALPFYPGTDLLQLFWCPMDHAEPIFVAKPFVCWRNARDVINPLRKMPKPAAADEQFIPDPCALFPEKVLEYPPFAELPAEIREAIDGGGPQQLGDLLDERKMESPSTLYEWELSVCPSNKVGGYVFWVQTPEAPDCECGTPMDLLLTLSHCECDAGTYRRWLPEEDQLTWHNAPDKIKEIVNAARFDGLGGGHLHVFVCRECTGWPIRSIYQR